MHVHVFRAIPRFGLVNSIRRRPECRNGRTPSSSVVQHAQLKFGTCDSSVLCGCVWLCGCVVMWSCVMVWLCGEERVRNDPPHHLTERQRNREGSQGRTNDRVVRLVRVVLVMRVMCGCVCVCGCGCLWLRLCAV